MSAEAPGMPSSEVIERLVVSAMILDKEAREVAATTLAGPDFYAPVREELFELICKLPRVDFTLVREALHGWNDVQREIMLREELDICMRQRQWVGGDFSIADYCAELRDRRVCRELMDLGGKLCVEGSKGIPVGAEFIDFAEAKFSAIVASRQGRPTEAREFTDELDSFKDDISDPDRATSRHTLAVTGLPDLDAVTGGIQRGDFYVILGRPGDGKSALTMQLAREVAISHRTLIFSYEMLPKQLTVRTVSAITGIDSKIITRGLMSPRQKADVTAAVEAMRALDMRFMPWRDKTLEEIRTAVRAEHRKRGDIGLIVVDSLQLMAPSKGMQRQNRDAQLAEVSRGLKALTMELNCAVFGVSSMNRDMKNRANKRPTMSDVRECGSIEFDANNIIGIFRPDADPTADVQEQDKGTAELIVMKQREGETGIVKCRFDGKTTTFLPSHSTRHLRSV